MNCNIINWRRHALERMFKRNISRSEVKEVLKVGKIIEVYSNDKPFASKLIFAYAGKKPLHIVVAQNDETQECYIITAYVPTEEYFDKDFIIRKK